MNYQLFLSAFRRKYRGVSDERWLYNFVREELQYVILQVLFTRGTFPLTFMGGTHLRLSYQLKRFSEDLDFVLDKPDPSFPAEEMLHLLEQAFDQHTTGFEVHFNLTEKRNVVKLMLSFSELLFDLGLSTLRDQTLKVKIEVDTNPAAHSRSERQEYDSFFQRYFVRSYDLGTGFAGKIGAILLREYQKGRDYFDLLWYLRRPERPSLNLDYINAVLLQQGARPFTQTGDILEPLKNHIQKLDLALLARDLFPFVMMEADDFRQWVKQYPSQTIHLLTQYCSKS